MIHQDLGSILDTLICNDHSYKLIALLRGDWNLCKFYLIAGIFLWWTQLTTNIKLFLPVNNNKEGWLHFFQDRFHIWFRRWLRHTDGPRLRTGTPVAGLLQMKKKLREKMKIRTSYVAVSGTPGNPGCTVHGLTQGEVRYLQVFIHTLTHPQHVVLLSKVSCWKNLFIAFLP